VLPARVIYSHSEFDRSRYFLPVYALNFRTNALASFQDTFSTVFWPPLKKLGFEPITATHSSCVTSYFPTAKL
jgi:hypothetical protein